MARKKKKLNFAEEDLEGFGELEPEVEDNDFQDEEEEVVEETPKPKESKELGELIVTSYRANVFEGPSVFTYAVAGVVRGQMLKNFGEYVSDEGDPMYDVEVNTKYGKVRGFIETTRVKVR